jgi:hypothetical protein
MRCVSSACTRRRELEELLERRPRGHDMDRSLLGCLYLLHHPV